MPIHPELPGTERTGQPRAATLLDAHLPEYDFAERHSLRVAAPASAVWTALWSADLGGPVVTTLLALRALPAFLAGKGPARARLAALRGGAPITLRTFVAHRFALLDESAERELVLGLVGRFWTAGGALRATDADRFRAGAPPGEARAAWGFSLHATPDGRGTLLSTETRVQCSDAASRRRFTIYWSIVRPFSGLLRRLMLRAIRREAERAATR